MSFQKRIQINVILYAQDISNKRQCMKNSLINNYDKQIPHNCRICMHKNPLMILSLIITKFLSFLAPTLKNILRIATALVP